VLGLTPQGTQESDLFDWVFVCKRRKNNKNNLLPKFTQASQFQKKAQGEREGKLVGDPFCFYGMLMFWFK
jgi:hypothetical protein